MPCCKPSMGPLGPPLKEAPLSGPDELCSYDKADAPFWRANFDNVRPIKFANKGPASKARCPEMTIHQLFKQACDNKRDKPALRVERNLPAYVPGKDVPPSAPLEEWKTWTYKEYYTDAWNLAKCFSSLGLTQRSAVNILGFNAPEWCISQVAGMIAGVAAGIYPTDTTDQLIYKCKHSDAAIICVDTLANFKKFEPIVNELPELRAIVCWDCQPPVEEIDRSSNDLENVKVLTFAKALEIGKGLKDEELQARVDAQQAGECCSLIYTSGTTGNPKAVMISHDNYVFESFACFDSIILNIGKADEEERALSYLPLSHVAGILVDVVSPLFISAHEVGYYCVCFARAYDLKAGTLGDRLRAVRPTAFLGVPRVWEKISEKMKAVGATTKGLKRKIATWAKKKGLEYQQNMQLGGTGLAPSSYARAEKVVLSKVKAALGLDCCKFAFSGAAPMQTETFEYFGSLGININDLYGMSECTGATTGSNDIAHVWGSVGMPYQGTEVKVFRVSDTDINDKTLCPRAKNIFLPTEEEQGEICFRGRNIMIGYLANPKLGEEHVAEIEAKNRGAIDDEGWMHSGDKGCMGVHGFCRITGRYKELIIGAGGENIAPVPIEDQLKKLTPAIANAIMVGDKRKYNVVLISLKAEGATGELMGTDKLDGAAKMDGVATIADACKNEKYINMITENIKELNKDGNVVVSNAAKIQKFTILPRDISVEGGELTPTLKIKRNVVANIHNTTIENMYTDEVKSMVYVPYKGEPDRSEVN